MPNSSPSGRLRVRVCGILVEQDKMLLVQLRSPVTDSLIWMPPGGGVERGESLQQTLIREFKEETGLAIAVGKLLYLNEFIEEPFHAIEFYFRVSKISGNPKLGSDPEFSEHGQILKDLKFFSHAEIQQLHLVPEFLKHDFWKLDDTFGLAV